MESRTPFKNVYYESSKPDSVDPLIKREDDNKNIGNSHVFSGIEILEHSKPVPEPGYMYPSESKWLYGLEKSKEGDIDTTPYKGMKIIGEVKENDDILDVQELATIEAPLYQTDLSNMTGGMIFGLQQIDVTDMKAQVRELSVVNRQDASGDAGTLGGGLNKADFEKFKEPKEEEEENPYDELK